MIAVRAAVGVVAIIAGVALLAPVEIGGIVVLALPLMAIGAGLLGAAAADWLGVK